MNTNRSFRFSKAIIRRPAPSIINAIRANTGPDPDYELFQRQHDEYRDALISAGASVHELPFADEFPDSVFIEDAAICLKKAAILLRPGAQSRKGETPLLKPVLKEYFTNLIEFPAGGTIDGGDVMLSDTHAFIGLSARTDETGQEALGKILSDFSYKVRKVATPDDILHFKTECGLLDENTIFATQKLSNTGCFDGYNIILVPEGEEAAANIIRYNNWVFLSAGFPKSEQLLRAQGYSLKILNTSQAALVDGGLSCMSLRF